MFAILFTPSVMLLQAFPSDSETLDADSIDEDFRSDLVERVRPSPLLLLLGKKNETNSCIADFMVSLFLLVAPAVGKAFLDSSFEEVFSIHLLSSLVESDACIEL